MQCNAEHPLVWIVRPIARTLCDALGLRKKTKSCAATLFILSVALLGVAWYVSRMFDPIIREIVQRHLQDYITQQLSRAAANYLVQLVISNALFVVLRSLIWCILYCLYELGRDRAFALILLVTLLLLSVVAGSGLLSEKPVVDFAHEHRVLLGLTSASALVTAWFWKTYVLANASGRRVFDFDIGSALSRLRPR